MLQTMAVRITEKTYPIVAACLPSAFMTVPLLEVWGCYLVINETSVVNASAETHDLHFDVDNVWYGKEEFLETYRWDTCELMNYFAPVHLI